MLYPKNRRWGAVGEQPTPIGSTPPSGRQGDFGEAIVAQAGGKYYEDAIRGRLCFAGASAGVATVTSISTTAMFSLFNPIASAYDISICKVSLGYFSGTLGAGPIFHCVNPVTNGIANPTAPTSGTALTSRFANIMANFGRSPVGEAKTGSTVVAPAVFRPFCSVNAILASTATGIFYCVDDMDEEIVLGPGGCYQIQAVCASGSTPLVALGVTWKEKPRLLPAR